MTGKQMAGWVLGAAALVFALGFLTQRGLTPSGATASEHEEVHSALDEQMEVLDKGMKKLRRSLRKDDELEASLAIVVEMQKAALDSKSETPPMIDKISEGDRASFAIGYRKEMANLVRTLLDMEIALLDGDSDKAQSIYESLKEIKKVGHEHYTQEG